MKSTFWPWHKEVNFSRAHFLMDLYKVAHIPWVWLLSKLALNIRKGLREIQPNWDPGYLLSLLSDLCHSVCIWRLSCPKNPDKEASPETSFQGNRVWQPSFRLLPFVLHYARLERKKGKRTQHLRSHQGWEPSRKRLACFPRKALHREEQDPSLALHCLWALLIKH